MNDIEDGQCLDEGKISGEEEEEDEEENEIRFNKEKNTTKRKKKKVNMEVDRKKLFDNKAYALQVGYKFLL